MNKLLQIIEQEDSIAIFRHVNPDGDALGSQYAIYQYIKDNYPEKKVYVFGERNDQINFFPYEETTDETVLNDAVAIVCDTANIDRIDGPYHKCKAILNIDHHPNDEYYGDEFIVDSTCSSTCEIVGELLLEGNKVSKKTASFLLSGILTDTNRFSVEATKPATLRVAADLMEKGANITELTQEYFRKRVKDFNYERIFAQDVQFDSGLASLVISKEKREEVGLNDRDAKQYATVMYNVKEFEINVIFVESDNGTFIGSLRSQNITVNDLAAKYRGGGHRLAAGFKAKNIKEVQQIKSELIEKIKESKTS